MPERSVNFLLADIARLMRREFELALAGTGVGLTLGEARTLAYVRRFPGNRQAALADMLCVEPMTLVGFLDRLEAAGLIERHPDPSDRRAKLVQLTAAAAPAMRQIDSAIQVARGKALAGFSAAQAAQVAKLLEAMHNNLTGNPAVAPRERETVA